MNENQNNKTEPSIDELIAQGEEMSSDKEKSKSFFKKPVGITIIILVIAIFAVLIYIQQINRTVNNNDNPTSNINSSNESKLEILDRLSKDNTTLKTSNEEKLNTLKNLSKSQEDNTTAEEKLNILNSLSN